MHYHVLRRLSSTASAIQNPNPLSFTQALQVAASRAWTRRATFTKPPHFSTFHMSKDRDRSGPNIMAVHGKNIATKRCLATSREHIIKPRCGSSVQHEHVANGVHAVEGIIPGDLTAVPSTSLPDSVNIPEMPIEDPPYQCQDARTVMECPSDSLEIFPEYSLATLDSDPSDQPSRPSLPIPTTRRMLYDNLRLSLTFKPTPNLPPLIDYHDTFPKLRSTTSYNLLIDIAIRHSQFGMAQWLFEAMSADKMYSNWTTRLLRVRYLVRTGNWEQAWFQSTGITPEDALDKPLRNGLPPMKIRIPWQFWVELLFSAKRGGMRHNGPIQRTEEDEKNDLRFPPPEQVAEPLPGTTRYLRRQRLISCIYPTFRPFTKYEFFLPRMTRGAVYAMLRDEQNEAAADLARKAFSVLPRDIDDNIVAQCLEIIHLFLSRNSRNGLPALYENHRLLQSMLKTHPSLKPSSETLVLLLAPLKRAKRCGTVAYSFMKTFQKGWGDKIVDSGVRRRVGLLAEKEGRLDIVKLMMQEQDMADWANSIDRPNPLSPNLSDRSPRRPPYRALYQHQGREESLWRTFRIRAKKKLRKADHK